MSEFEFNIPEFISRLDPFLIFGASLFGSFVTYLFSLNKGFEGATKALRTLFPSRSDLFIDRLDFVVVVFSGALIGLLVFQPSSPFQAFAGGVGWVAALNTVISKSDEGQGTN